MINILQRPVVMAITKVLRDIESVAVAGMLFKRANTPTFAAVMPKRSSGSSISANGKPLYILGIPPWPFKVFRADPKSPP
mmetsp:Transcript_93356/g.165166  ORF Transcript_93356/g.165166 Transcript_93356/m.165166 type:complete len:80 (-) Transcript_93356:367-606(-)